MCVHYRCHLGPCTHQVLSLSYIHPLAHTHLKKKKKNLYIFRVCVNLSQHSHFLTFLNLKMLSFKVIKQTTLSQTGWHICNNPSDSGGWSRGMANLKTSMGNLVIPHFKSKEVYRDGLVARSTRSYRGHGYNSSHLYSISQLSITLVLKDLTCSTHTCMQAKYSYT